MADTYSGMYAEVYERQLRNAKKEQKTINELLTLGLIRKMREREARKARGARGESVIEASSISYTYKPLYEDELIYKIQNERQLRNAKKEQETINELLTLGLIRKMREREERSEAIAGGAS